MRSLDHQAFLDIHGIPGGSEWEKQLIERGKWCDVLIVLVTEASSQSKYVYDEFREAEKNKKLIIPIRVGDVLIPPHLTHLNAIPFSDDNYDSVILKIESAIRQVKRSSAISKPLLIGVVLLIFATLAVIVGALWSGNNGNQTSVAQLSTETSIPPTDEPILTLTPVVTDTVFPSATNTNTLEPTNTPTVTMTSTPRPTNTSLPTSRPIITSTRIGASTETFSPITANSDWTPIEREFNGLVMVLVPPGCFNMGRNNAGGRQCFDQPFWISKYEVTNSQYAGFIDDGGYTNNTYWTTSGRNLQYVNYPGKWLDRRFNAQQKPVAGVSWFEAYAFAKWLSCRLPTEAEWEYAARGPDNLIYPWGNTFNSNKAVYSSNSNRQPAEVGSKLGGVSWVGALDMIGNVWEWTNSRFMSYPYDASTDRENIQGNSNRVWRGGSWFDSGDWLMAFARDNYSANDRQDGGIRIVCDDNLITR